MATPVVGLMERPEGLEEDQLTVGLVGGFCMLYGGAVGHNKLGPVIREEVPQKQGAVT